MSGGNHEMKVMKRIILALFFVLAGCSVALCDDDYVYIDSLFGADWYLNKYRYILFHNGNSDMVSCLLKAIPTPRYYSYLLFTLDNWELLYDRQFQFAAEGASYFLFHQVVDMKEYGDFLTTRISAFDYKETLLAYIDIPAERSSLIATTLVGVEKGKIRAWIKRNPPDVSLGGEMDIYDTDSLIVFAKLNETSRKAKQTKMQNTAQSQVVEAERKDNTMSTTAIVVFILIGAVILSVSLGLFLEYLANRVIGPDNLIPPEQPPEKNAQESEVIDAEFMDVNESDDYEYPYEDISKVVGEKQ